MSNESNNMVYLQRYIIRNMIGFFSNESENITSRYVLYFDSMENIISFEKSIRDVLTDKDLINNIIIRIGNPNLSVKLMPDFLFYNDDGGLEYEAIHINIKSNTVDRNIIFISDCDESGEVLGDAFKNGIRNKFVDENLEGILFYLSVQNIASVSKTTENFQRQGLPLNINNVYENLRLQVSIVNGESQQKVVLYALNKIKANKSANDISLVDFAPIIRIIESKNLDEDDFHDLHMFKMTLADLGKKDSKLAENYKLFRDISLALEDKEIDEILSSYQPKIIKEIKSSYESDENNWDKNITFESIQKSQKTTQKKFKLESIVIVDEDDNELEQDYYFKFEKRTSASFVIVTKDYSKNKKFGIIVRFSQKVNSESEQFMVEELNAKGTTYKIIVESNVFENKEIVKFTNSKDEKFSVLISVINVNHSFFSDTLIGFTKGKKNYEYVFRANDYTVILGDMGEKINLEEKISNNSNPIPINTENTTTIDFKFSEGESTKKYSVKLNLNDNSAIINTSIKFEETKLRLLELFKIFNMCMLKNESFYLEDGDLYNRHKHSERYQTDQFDVAGFKYNINSLLKLEREIIENKYKYVNTLGLNIIKPFDCNLPKDVCSIYDEICDFFIRVGTTPSISNINNELFNIYERYVSTVLEYIDDNSNKFKDKKQISNDILQLLNLGMVKDNDGFIWLSPLNPLSIAYQSYLKNEKNKWIELDEYLYESLGFGNMLPFIADKNDSIFQAVRGSYPIQWACYCDASKSIKGNEKIYYEKILDYYTKFKYLFDNVANRPFLINVIGIQHTFEIVKALLALYISKNIDPKIFYIEINYYYSNTGKNDFDDMTEYGCVYNRAKQIYGGKKAEYVEAFCDWYFEHVKYYACYDSEENHQYKYAHISFCALESNKKTTLSNTISTSNSGIMLDGLISDVPSTLDRESGIYKYGFGAAYMGELLQGSALVRLAYAYNELAKCKEGSPASRDISIAQGIQNTKSEKLDEIYKSSNWVVFVEPKIDLDFFIEQGNDSDEDLIIIHYPDKNLTSAGYTSITVTKKSEQYINVINEYLKNKLPMYSKKFDVKNIIRNYNAYSGEWLMNFINNKQVEEKISLVSAIKFCRSYFANIYPDYIWVPVALDEILRVTGSIGGTLTNLLFSKKVLEKRGIIESQNATSDDLLFAGIKVTNNNVHVVYVPVEVKHGKCDFKIRSEAHNQVCNTAYLLKNTFLEQDKDNNKRVDKKIYRNYMIQHIISNVEKMLSYKIVETQEYINIVDSELRVKLLNDDYLLDIDKNTDMYAFYFVEGNDNVSKSQNSKDRVIELSVSISDMYEFLVNDEKIVDDIRQIKSSKMVEDLSEYEISVSANDFEEDVDDEYGDRESDKLDDELSEINNTVRREEIDNNLKLELFNKTYASERLEENGTTSKELSNIRVLLGKDIARNNIYWEFGNSQLANRHLLITGTSGQGKTYSIQTMLYELAKSNISSVIFDYTEGFMKTQLENIFVDRLGEHINEKIVYSTGVPINPFVRHEIDIAGTTVVEKAADVASRLADIFSHVYDFGEQQSSAIFSAALKGINIYGEQMNMSFFQKELEKIVKTNRAAKTVISKMEPFFQTISFEGSSDFNWGDVLYSEKSDINIFQLTLINREIQVIITELMLWDAWYYTKKFGNKEKPFVVVLDEAQNLSHKSNSPSAAILTEGRKFGWSAWFATQSLKVLKDEEVTRLSQAAFKLYFKPTDDEVVKISKLLDPTGEINWISDVKNLQKGQCIVAGNRMNSIGIFGSTQPTVVSVSSFEQR